MKKIFAWVVAGLLALGSVQYQRVAERRSYEHMQQSTVLIVASDGSGSGVVIERWPHSFIWTANHVVENDSEVGVKQFIRAGGRKVGEVVFKARVIARDAERDIALLWLDCPVGFFRAADFADDSISMVGTPLTHVGNVLGGEFDGSVSTGIVSQVGVHPEKSGWPWTQPLDQGTFAAFYGGSGGPVFYQRSHKVAGLLVGGLVGKGYINYVPVREISKFARKAGVSWAVNGRGCPSDGLLEALAQAVAQDLKPKSEIFSVN